MAEGNDYSSIGPLDAAAGKEGLSLLGNILLVMVVALAAYFIIGTVANM